MLGNSGGTCTRNIMYNFHDSSDTLKFWTEKRAINKTFLLSRRKPLFGDFYILLSSSPSRSLLLKYKKSHYEDDIPPVHLLKTSHTPPIHHPHPPTPTRTNPHPHIRTDPGGPGRTRVDLGGIGQTRAYPGGPGWTRADPGGPGWTWTDLDGPRLFRNHQDWSK